MIKLDKNKFVPLEKNVWGFIGVLSIADEKQN